MKKLHASLGSIRAANPGLHTFRNVVASLGFDATNFAQETVVSIGDVADCAGANEACWCVIRCLDWADIGVRRMVVAALMPTVRRAIAADKDPRVHRGADIIDRWIAGDQSANIGGVWPEMCRVAHKRWSNGDAHPAAEAVGFAAECAGEPDAKMAAIAATDVLACALTVASVVAVASSVDQGAAVAHEKMMQARDLVAAFPPLHPRNIHDEGPAKAPDGDGFPG